MTADVVEPHATREDLADGARDLVVLLAAIASLDGVGGGPYPVHPAGCGALLRRPGRRNRSRSEAAAAIRRFPYPAFTLGTTFQVSDTDVSTHELRVTVSRHALLSFLFGSVVLATAINLVRSLASGSS